MPYRSDLQAMLDHQRTTNKPIDATPMKLITTLISTQHGWIIRQIMKYAAELGALLTGVLTAHGVGITDPNVIGTALATIAVGAAEKYLSKLASPIATKA